jgi:hypothetical protein
MPNTVKRPSKAALLRKVNAFNREFPRFSKVIVKRQYDSREVNGKVMHAAFMHHGKVLTAICYRLLGYMVTTWVEPDRVRPARGQAAGGKVGA